MGCCCKWRAPRQLRYVLPTIVIAIIAWLYSSFVWFAQPLLVAAGVHGAELLAFHVMTMLLCTSLARCMLSTESFIPKNTSPRWRQQQQALQRKREMAQGSNDAQSTDTPSGADTDATGNASESSAAHTAADLSTLLVDDMVECKMNGEMRYCRKCRAVKPDRAHHCSTCRRCVLKMDHHCVYINKCIGFYNYKFFLLFLGWSAATCLHQSSLLFRYLLADSIDHTAKLFVYGRLQLLSPSLQILLVFFTSFCLGAALLCFYAMHLFFTVRNYSTVEYCEKRREPFYTNYFDRGVARNVQSVFGTVSELPFWFVPVQSPSVVQSRGRSFPVNAKFVKQD